jgi:hypothetical protein
MADLSESDYGMFDYGDGYYSLRPIWLFASDVRVPFHVNSDFTVFAFRKFESTVSIHLDALSSLGLAISFEGHTRFEFFVQSDEYLGKFWEPWKPDDPDIGDWNPDSPDDGNWSPVPPFGENWIPDVPIYAAWGKQMGGQGPWEPVGPDMSPNRP